MHYQQCLRRYSLRTTLIMCGNWVGCDSTRDSYVGGAKLEGLQIRWAIDQYRLRFILDFFLFICVFFSIFVVFALCCFLCYCFNGLKEETFHYFGNASIPLKTSNQIVQSHIGTRNHNM